MMIFLTFSTFICRVLATNSFNFGVLNENFLVIGIHFDKKKTIAGDTLELGFYAKNSVVTFFEV